MTYFGFLLIFLGLPLLYLLVLSALDSRGGRLLPAERRGVPFQVALWLHVLIAVLYTTPWDNYLVATGVWFYNPKLVTGMTLGWVPVEEYTFFILQTLMTGLCFYALARRIPIQNESHPPHWTWRIIPVFILGGIWAWALFSFISGWRPGTYLTLILLWALPPIMLQFLFGGDILWHERKIVGLTLALATLYLSISDSLAIGSGTWIIDPGQSLEIFLAGVLPLEEFFFFLATNCLIVFGITLLLSFDGRVRFMFLAGKKRAGSQKIPQE